MSEQPRTLEFRNNGVVDSLTLTMAPALFYENLRRELANSQRQGFPISVVSLSLKDQALMDQALMEQASAIDVQPNSHSPSPMAVSSIEEVLIRWAFALQQGIRSDEFFSRISESGFWWLVHGDRAVATLAVDRIAQLLAPDPRFDFHIHPWKQGQSFEDLVAELDKAQFSTERNY